MHAVCGQQNRRPFAHCSPTVAIEDASTPLDLDNSLACFLSLAMRLLLLCYVALLLVDRLQEYLETNGLGGCPPGVSHTNQVESTVS